MPSLPDLSLNLRVPFYKDFLLHEKECSSPYPPAELLDEEDTSLGFEINHNNMLSLPDLSLNLKVPFRQGFPVQ